MRKVSLLLLSLFFTASLAFSQIVFINEIHYDNTGTDVDEGVEIAGPATTDLTCYKLYFYNGNGGTVYDSISLSGTIDNEGAGFGAVWFAVAGIQNGSPDGVALYDSCNSTVVQFLSYEGTMTATSGVASGMLSVDLGVQENTGDPVGFSLQLQGTGVIYTDFTWNDSIAHTRDFINTGQVFSLGSNPAPCTEPFFSEYIEGSSNNKAVEIYNPTTSTINLSNYRVEYFSNGSVMPTVTYNLSGTLAPGEVYVYAADQANAAILAETDDTLSFPSAAHFNGNDAFALVKGLSTVVDVFGIIGQDPGSSWTIGTGATANYTLVRKSNVQNGQLDTTLWKTEWDVYPQDFSDSLGTHYMIPCGVVTPPTFSFSPSIISVNEGAGTVDITVAISTAADCSVEVALDVVGSTATQGSDFTFTSPQVLTFTASGPTTQTITIPIIDDATAEGDETIEFNLQNTSGTGGCNIGTPSVMMVTIEDNDYQYLPIIQVHGEDPAGVALSDGDKAELRGIVTYPNTRPNGLQFYIQDATAGINVFSFNDQFGYTVTLGDSIIVRGTIDQFNGLTEIIPDTIIVGSTANPLPAYQTVDSLGEYVESELVELYGYSLTDPTQWTNSGSGFNVDVTNGNDTLQIRIDNDVALFGTTAPTGLLIIRGPVTQYDPSSPYFDGYQVLPAALTDIEEIQLPVAAFSYTLAMPAVTVTDASTNADSIVWDFDDGTIISDQTPYTHTYTANGTYDICLTVYNIAGSDTECQSVTITGIGIDEPVGHMTQLYPVPVKDQLLINTTLNVDFVEVINIAGQVVKTIKVDNKSIAISTSDIAAGLYLVRIHAEEGVVMRKIVKE